MEKKPYILRIYYYNRPGKKDQTVTACAFCLNDKEAMIIAQVTYPEADKIEIEKFLELE